LTGDEDGKRAEGGKLINYHCASHSSRSSRYNDRSRDWGAKAEAITNNKR